MSLACHQINKPVNEKELKWFKKNKKKHIYILKYYEIVT